MIGRMDERIKQDRRGITTAPARPDIASGHSARPASFPVVSALCLLLVASLTVFNGALVVLLMNHGALWGVPMHEAHLIALALATVLQAGLFAALWLPLSAVTLRWPDRPRCAAAAGLTVAYLGGGLALNVWVATCDPGPWHALNVWGITRNADDVWLGAVSLGALLLGLWLHRRSRLAEASTGAGHVRQDIGGVTASPAGPDVAPGDSARPAGRLCWPWLAAALGAALLLAAAVQWRVALRPPPAPLPTPAPSA
jgi:hypothetical protein